MEIRSPDHWLHYAVGGGRPTKKGWVRSSRSGSNTTGKELQSQKKNDDSILSNWMQKPGTVRNYKSNATQISNDHTRIRTGIHSLRGSSVAPSSVIIPLKSSRVSLQRATSSPDPRIHPSSRPQASQIRTQPFEPQRMQRKSGHNRRASSPGPQPGQHSSSNIGGSRDSYQSREWLKSRVDPSQDQKTSTSRYSKLLTHRTDNQRPRSKPGSFNSREERSIQEQQRPQQSKESQDRQSGSVQQSLSQTRQMAPEFQGEKDNTYGSEEEDAQSAFSVEEKESRAPQPGRFAHGARSFYEGVVTGTKVDRYNNRPSRQISRRRT